MTRTPRIAIVTAMVVGLAACSGAAADDETTDETMAADTTSASPMTDDAPADVTTTAAPEDVPPVPSAYGDEVRTVAVIGDALPEYAGSIENDPAVGMVAPGLIGEDYSGTQVVAAHGTDRPTLVVFLAHWCPHCNDEIPELNELRDAGRWPAGLDIVAVSTAIAPDRPNFPPSRWIVEKDWTYPVIADELDMGRESFTAASAYGVTGFPFMTLVGSDGRVLARWSGSAGADAIEALVTGLIDQPADA